MAGPDGIRFDQAVVRWALETYLGVAERDPEPIAYDGVRAQEIAGVYETGTTVLTIGTTGTGMTLEVVVKPELRAEMGQEVPDYVRGRDRPACREMPSRRGAGLQNGTHVSGVGRSRARASRARRSSLRLLSSTARSRAVVCRHMAWPGSPMVAAISARLLRALASPRR